MEKKKNIISIRGKDIYGVQSETQRLIEAFKLRQDSNNIDTYRIEEIKDWRRVTQSMQTLWIFVEKRLFVFSGSLKKEPSRTGEISKAEKKSSEAENFLLEICENMSDDTFLIFSGVETNPKSLLTTWLEKNADVRVYDSIWNVATWQSRYSILTPEEIQSVMKKYKQSEDENEKWWNMIAYALGQSLEKLSLLKESRILLSSDFEDSLILESWGKMYDFSDAILRADAKRALNIFHSLLEGMNIHAFLASFLWLIRTSVYVKYYKSLWKSQSQIGNMISAHAFVIQKSYESRINYTDLFHFYEKVLWLNIAYRSGKWRKDPELWRIFDIELAIMGLKK